MELRMTWIVEGEDDSYTIMGTREEIEDLYREIISTGEFVHILVEKLDERVV